MTASPQDARNILPLISKPSTSYVAVDPDTASRWLAGNVVNRNLRAAKVNQYARDMTAGRWTLNNDAVCFAPDGQLLNGQHRLRAIVESGCTVLLLVARNMPPESMTNMDSGSARTAADAFKFFGEKNQALLAATAKLCLVVSDGRVYKDTKTQAVSAGELHAFVERNPDVRSSTHHAMLSRSSVDCPPSAMACAHWMIGRAAGSEYADHYLRQLATRNNEPAGSPVLAVDSRLREVRRARAVYPQRNFVYLLIKGWNYYARGETVRTLVMAPKTDNEFRIPTPARWQR